MNVSKHCAQCGCAFVTQANYANRAAKEGRRMFCSKACFGLSRRLAVPKTDEEKKSEKAAYDRKYRALNAEKLKAEKAAWYQRNRDPDKERAHRQARMHLHVEYCRRPEYRIKKHEYDRKRNESEWGEWAEVWRLLQDLEKEIRSQASAYERRVANGYYTRNAQKRRRELCQIRKNLTPAI